MSNLDHALLKPYDQIQHIAKDSEQALGYIIHHFNIDRVSRSLCWESYGGTGNIGIWVWD